MKPLTAAEVKAELSRLPEQYRDQALRLLWAACDEGISLGLANAPRSMNPFLPADETAKTKGKRR